MARPKHANPREEVHVRLFPKTIERLNLISFDPFYGKLSTGDRNAHLENALEEYFERYYPLKKALATESQNKACKTETPPII